MSCLACFVSARTDPETVIQSQTVCVPHDCGDDPILKVTEIDVIANSPEKWGC